MTLDILQTVEDKKLYESIGKMNRMLLVTREIHDCMLHYYMFKLIGATLLRVGKATLARLVFESMRDVASECQQWGNYLDAYDLIGRACEAQGEHLLAINAYKRMMQMAWFVDSSIYEAHSYFALARCYFYS